jgi:predicted secreted protein
MPVAHVQSTVAALTDDVGEHPLVADLPGHVTVTVGDEALLRLPSLAPAGYRWEAAADDPQILEASIRFEAASPAGSDAHPSFGAHELLVLRGHVVGSTRVNCVQRRSWEEGTASAEHSVAVDVVDAAGKQSTEKGR